MVVAPGRLARGKAEIRRAFEDIMASHVTAHQERTCIIEAAGTALFISRWFLITKMADGTSDTRQFVATSVLKRHEGGEWQILIDNAFGPAILDH